MFVIKIKGIKSDFSRDPIDYKKLRKDDIHSPRIPAANQFRINQTIITEINISSINKGVIIFLHGGAFVYGPARHHWETLKKLAKETSCRVWMVDYPKAPDSKIDSISQNIDMVYEYVMKNFGNHRIILAGDSAGGTLAAALTQRLIVKGAPLPFHLILVSPVMDSSFRNEKINSLDVKDPMLSKAGAVSAKKMCAVNGDLEDPAISPINGDFKNFPSTLLFIAENDITSPDQEILVSKLIAAKVNIEVIRGKGMPHIWPLLPVMKESKIAMNQMIAAINRITT
jgi:acetyl esterase/lipase